MKLYIRPYHLNFKNKKKPLHGALLLFEFSSGAKGYSDFLPHPHLTKEKSLKEQLEDVKKGKESLRFQLAKKTAQRDALGREKKINLFFGLKVPESHFLIEDLNHFTFQDMDKIQLFNYKTVKLKVSKDLKNLNHLKELQKKNPHLKWRLDGNGHLKKSRWFEFKKKFHFLWHNLEFIEDPFLQPETFNQKETLFAEDWIPNSKSSIRIVKPTRDPLSSLQSEVAASRWKHIVFTHNQDSLLGQAIAAYWAAQFYKVQPRFYCSGAFKCFSFKEARWTAPLKETPHFECPSGFGLGFGNLLEKENWKSWI